MSLRLTPERAEAIKAAMDALCLAAEGARAAPDTVAARKALSEVWFAVHVAQMAVADAEVATRQEALRAARAEALEKIGA